MPWIYSSSRGYKRRSNQSQMKKTISLTCYLAKPVSRRSELLACGNCGKVYGLQLATPFQRACKCEQLRTLRKLEEPV